jgi:hypothetical protein
VSLGFARDGGFGLKNRAADAGDPEGRQQPQRRPPRHGLPSEA